MTIRPGLTSMMLVAVLSLPSSVSAQHEHLPPSAFPPYLTAGGALAEVSSAIRRAEAFTVSIVFSTDDSAYGGEVIYEDIPPEDVVRRVYVQAGDRDYPLRRFGGEVAMPSALHLSPYEGEGGRFVVGAWEAAFEPPASDLREIMLYLPNVGPIGPFPIRNR